MQWKHAAVASLFLIVGPFTAVGHAKSHLGPAWCQKDGFFCLRVKGGQSWESLFPDDRERDMVMRINRTNTMLYPSRVIMVPDNLERADVLDFSPFPVIIEPQSEKVIVFDPNRHAYAAYDSDGTLLRWGPATGGAKWCDDIQSGCITDAGEYRIYTSGNSDCISSKFPLPDGGAPMPYCMFFNGGQAFHGSPGGVIKGNVSHGCVRLFVEDAEWMRYDFVEPPMAANRYRGTKVVVLPYDTA